MGFKDYCFRKSLWVFHISEELLAIIAILKYLPVLRPGTTWKRFGILLAGSIRHADVLLVNGSINKRDKDRLLEIYKQAPNLFW